MIAAVILAAGQSRRMGTQKLLLPFGGSAVIAHLVDRVLESVAEHVIVVVGPDGEGIRNALSGRPVFFVTNPQLDSEMLASVRCGLRALPAGCEAVLVVPGDLPGLTPALVEAMAEAFRTSGKGIVVPTHHGQRGHPLLVSVRYCGEILTSFGEEGLRGLLRQHPDDLYELPVADPAVLADMDLPEDYARELARRDSNPRDDLSP